MKLLFNAPYRLDSSNKNETVLESRAHSAYIAHTYTKQADDRFQGMCWLVLRVLGVTQHIGNPLECEHSRSLYVATYFWRNPFGETPEQNVFCKDGNMCGRGATNGGKMSIHGVFSVVVSFWRLLWQLPSLDLYTAILSRLRFCCSLSYRVGKAPLNLQRLRQFRFTFPPQHRQPGSDR